MKDKTSSNEISTTSSLKEKIILFSFDKFISVKSTHGKKCEILSGRRNLMTLHK